MESKLRDRARVSERERLKEKALKEIRKALANATAYCF